MLDSITLIDFQKHKKRTIEFSPGVTTLVGRSRAGKTSVIRALIWLCLNRPRGDHIIRHGADGTKAILRLDGRKVVRKKRKGKENSYAVDGKVFKAFSSKVPDEVEKVLNVSEINFQRQLDPPFWFTLSPGDVSKNLNQIVNLGAIDDALSRAASETRRAHMNLEVRKEALKDAIRRKKELRWVPEFLADLERYETIERQYKHYRDSRASVASAVGELLRYSRRAVRVRELTLGAANAVRLGAETLNVASRAAELRNLVANVIASAERLASPAPDITELQAVRDDADATAERRRKLESLLEDTTNTRDRVWELDRELETADRRLISVTPKTCPACGQTIPVNRSRHSAQTCTSHITPRSPAVPSRTGMPLRKDS